jgi:hypothetical protein
VIAASNLSAEDLALVVVTGCAVLATIALLATLAWLVVALRRATRALHAFTDQALPLVEDLASSLAEANEELARVDRLVGSAESISATVDATSKLAYRALSAPVIKTVAVTSGASRAARRLRKE